MDKRVALGVGLGLGLLLLLGRWFLFGEEPESAGQLSPSAPAVVVKIERTSRTARPALARDSEEGLPLEDFEADDPGEEAVAALAAALGAGVIRCELPPDSPEVRHGLRHGHQVGNKVVALVDEPVGVALVRRPKPTAELLEEDRDAWRAALRAAREPLGHFVWSGAEPGKVGKCVWEEAQMVRLQGRVDGELRTKTGKLVWLNGCDTGGSKRIAEDGTFDFMVPRQSNCTLEVGSSGFGQYGTQIQPLADVEGIVVVRMPASVGKDTTMLAEMKANAVEAEEDLAEFESGEDEYSAALQAQGLSSDSQVLLRSWRINGTAEAENSLEHFRRTAEVLAKREAAASEE
jgi:hypothetical protein